MPVIDISGGSNSSSWVEWTNPTDNQLDVSRVDPIVVKFTRLIDTDSFNSDNIKLMDEFGNELPNGLDPISVTNDYNPLLGTLELHLSAALSGMKMYSLFIDGLYDPVGDSQDLPHIIFFTTNESDESFELAQSGDSVINVVDKTIANADLVPVANAGVSHQMFMNPAGGAYNVDKSVEKLSLTVAPADLDPLDTLQFTVERRVISDSEMAWSTVGASGIIVDTGHVEITLPSYGSGFVEPGYEYHVSVSVGADVFDFLFCGELSPMFCSVSSVLQQSSSLSSLEVAKSIYLASAYIVSIDSSMASRPTKAARDYALYSTLAMLNPIDTMESYTLADLSVKRAKSSQQRFAELAEAALNKLGGGPRFLIKGSSNTSPHAQRDFGSTNPRIGK